MLEGVATGYKWLQGVTRDYKGLQMITETFFQARTSLDTLSCGIFQRNQR